MLKLSITMPINGMANGFYQLLDACIYANLALVVMTRMPLHWHGYNEQECPGNELASCRMNTGGVTPR